MSDPILQLLLAIHIFAGFSALVAGLIATGTMFFDSPHKWHVRSGAVFVWGMVGIVITALPIAWIKGNYPLLLIAIFSGYLALSGWRYAKNRAGTPTRMDWGRVGVMGAASIAMILYGISIINRGNLSGITLLVFGAIGGGLATFDGAVLRKGGAKGKTRIAHHLTMMLAGFIATATAFLVTNFSFQPAFVLWLAPTVLLTPIIFWWTAKIEGGRKPRGMPDAQE